VSLSVYHLSIVIPMSWCLHTNKATGGQRTTSSTSAWSCFCSWISWVFFIAIYDN